MSFESRAVFYIQCIRRVSSVETFGPAHATGFYWSNEEQLYQVTNWHCVTGLNADTGTPIGSFAPTHLRVWFNENQDGGPEGGKFVKFVGRELSLYDPEGLPTWIEHQSGNRVDVVAIPLDGYDWKERILPLNLKRPIPHNPMAGEDCYIVGYPEGLLGPNGTPIWKRASMIWKRASIATEPELNYDGRPLFLVDSATRPGLSGAPVLIRVNGLWGQEGARIVLDGATPAPFGAWINFVGIYAGREGGVDDGFQLARIWKRTVPDEIIANGAPGRCPLV